MKLISQHAIVSILVQDQEEALCFYTQRLGLEKRRDITYGLGMRLLTVAPEGQQKPELALAKPDISLSGEERVKELLEHIGQKVLSIFVTDNCCREYENLKARGVSFVCAPQTQLYGIEAVFKDPYGNTFSLLEAAPGICAQLEHRNFGTAA
jgi:predicted enzyme related to lactoylglutathione lyase